MPPRAFQSRVQDLVYNLDVGLGIKIIKVTLALAGVFILILLYTVQEFRGLREAEAMDAAQIGRSYALDGTLTTRVVRPYALFTVLRHGLARTEAARAAHAEAGLPPDTFAPAPLPGIHEQPDLLHAPGWPMVLGWFFRATGTAFEPAGAATLYVPDRQIYLLNHLLAVVATALVYLLGRMLFSHRVAILATILYVLSDLVWADSVSGLGVTLAGVLVLVTLVLAAAAGLAREKVRPVWMWVVPTLLSGITLGLAVLTRYGCATLAPGLAVYYLVVLRRRSWIPALAMLLLAGAMVAPWVVRNLEVSGRPFGLAPHTAFNDTRMYPDDSLFRSVNPQLPGGRDALGLLRVKAMRRAPEVLGRQVFGMGGGVVMALFFTTFFYRWSRRTVRALRWGAGLTLLLLVGVASVFGPSSVRLLHVLWPVAVIYGTAFFFLLLDRLDLRRPILILGLKTALVAASSYPIVLSLLPPRREVPYPPYYVPFVAEIGRMMQPGELLSSDIPWATAWYGARTTVQKPNTLDEWYEVNDRIRLIRGLYVTQVTRERPFSEFIGVGRTHSWAWLLVGRPPPLFPLREVLPINNAEQLFITDRPRWAR